MFSYPLIKEKIITCKDKSFVMNSGIYHIRIAHFNFMVTLIYLSPAIMNALTSLLCVYWRIVFNGNKNNLIDISNIKIDCRPIKWYVSMFVNSGVVPPQPVGATPKQPVFQVRVGNPTHCHAYLHNFLFTCKGEWKLR